MQIYLRHVILVCLIILGLAPVIAQITINRPEVLMQVQGYAERQKLHRLESEQKLLENRLSHLLELLRVTSLLPAPREILGYAQQGSLNPERAASRFEAVMRGWFVHRSAVLNLRVINLEGVEQLRLLRHADGTLVPTILDLENKRNADYMTSGIKDYRVTGIAPNKQFGESDYPDTLTLQVTFPIFHRSVTVGFMVFTIDALRLLQGYDGFAWYDGAGLLIKAASDADKDTDFALSMEEEEVVAAGKPAVIQSDRFGARQGWLPLHLNPQDGETVWIVLPLERDIIESWVNVFNENTIILFSVILVVVFIVATVLTLLIERFIKRLLASVKSILDEREVNIDFGPFGEMVKLSDGLSGLARQHQRDAEARAEAEAQLTESRNRIELLLSSASESIVGVEQHGRITFCNPAALNLLGASDEKQLQGKRFASLLLEQQGGTDTTQLANGNKLRSRIHLPEVSLRRLDDRVLAAEFWSHPIQRDDNAEGAVFTLVDITVRKQVQEEVQRLRQLLTNIIDSMPSVLIGVDDKMQVTQWNRAAEKMFAVPTSKAVGLRIDVACSHLAEEMTRIRTALREGRIERSSKLTMVIDGSERFVDLTAYPLEGDGVNGAVVLIDDVTERSRMEDMMVQSEKMLSVGGLAAGMAHEINNPLAGILQNVQVLRNRLLPDLPANRRAADKVGVSMDLIQSYAATRGLFEMMDSVMNSGQRAAKVVENMLSFSRKSDSSYAPHDMAELLDQSAELAGNDYDLKKKYDFRQVEVLREFEADLPMVACEKPQIQQVVINLLRNACQAMTGAPEHDKPPRITLRLRRAGKRVCMEIEDNGPGMSEEVRKRVFEPFFTTKAVGVGTGLGLSVSYFIITENHAGSMGVKSSPGNGTCFTLCLPIKKSSSLSKRNPA